VRVVRTDPAQSSGLRSKETASRWRGVFIDFYLYRTYQELEVGAIKLLFRYDQCYMVINMPRKFSSDNEEAGP